MAVGFSVLERESAGPPLVATSNPVEGTAARLNARLGVGITDAVGSMWAAYAFALLSLISLPAAITSGSLLVIVAWIAQTFLQLVLLPIIIVGQNVQSAAADARAVSTFEDAEALLHINQQIQAHMRAQDDAIIAVLNHLGIDYPVNESGPGEG